MMDALTDEQNVGAIFSNQIASRMSLQASKTMVAPDINSRSETGIPLSQRTPTKSPSKSRSFSESLPKLSPSPKFREPKKESKDDHTIISSPKTPRRPELLSRGLSLQMPPRESGIPNSSLTARAPLSPQLDRTHTYASPIHLLPRRSRGAEFSRACTNLHHSTLAEQSSPDSSPTITQKGMMIPSRKARTSSFMDSHHPASASAWTSGGNNEKSAISSSVGSVNMIATDDSSSSGSDMEDTLDQDDNDDPMLMTPQITKAPHNIPSPFGFASATAQSPGWPTSHSPGAPNFMTIQRARLRHARSRKSTSSASGRSSLASPGPASPPHIRHMEGGGSYFAREVVMRKPGPRRESLSLHTNDLHISSGNDSGDEAGGHLPATPGVVIRRTVTRRGNLLPRSRQFGRIKAELFEESVPIDSEAKREAEIIRQVRENDADYDSLQPSTAHSSPSLIPTSGVAESLEEIPEDTGMSLDTASTTSSKGLFGTFGAGAFGFSTGPRGSWNYNTPSQTPPPPFLPRGSSSAISDDFNMESPAASSASARGFDGGQATSRGGTPQAPAPPTAAEGLKKSNKRRRDDDLDVNSMKRRAVSPGVSVHNSPILSQSPGQRDGPWGAQRISREGSVSGHVNGERSGSGGSMAMTPVMGPKRIGLQGMTDTNDGLMKMSIE